MKPGKTDPDEFLYRTFLHAIANEDVKELKRKDEEYGGSWLRRGGTGAYHAAIRKADRLDTSVAKFGYDVFEAIAKDERSEGIIDDIRDLRRYLLLWEARAMELRIGPYARQLSAVTNLTTEVDFLQAVDDLTNGPGVKERVAEMTRAEHLIFTKAPNPDAVARTEWEKRVLPDPNDVPPRVEIFMGRTREELDQELNNAQVAPGWFQRMTRTWRGPMTPDRLVIPSGEHAVPFLTNHLVPDVSPGSLSLVLPFAEEWQRIAASWATKVDR